jgi:hypothetical protein
VIRPVPDPPQLANAMSKTPTAVAAHTLPATCPVNHEMARQVPSVLQRRPRCTTVR